MNFYGFAQRVCLFIFKLYFKFEVKGLNNVEDYSSGLVLISNHISYLDPIFLGLFLKRKLFFMAKAELFKVPLLKTIIKKLGAFPVNRNANDSNAIKTAVAFVETSKIVAMFPQGHRSKKIESLKPKTGFVRIALMSKAKVIPCSLYYNSYLPRSKVYIYYGEAVSFDEVTKNLYFNYENVNFKYVKELTVKIWQKVLNFNYIQKELYNGKKF